MATKIKHTKYFLLRIIHVLRTTKPFITTTIFHAKRSKHKKFPIFSTLDTGNSLLVSAKWKGNNFKRQHKCMTWYNRQELKQI